MSNLDLEDQQIAKMREEPEVRKAVEGVRELESLKDSGPWLYLRKRFEGYSELVAGTVAKRLLRGEEIGPQELGFCRGYAAAIEDILDTPERVEDELENAAAKAWRRVQEQNEESSEFPPNQ